MALVMVARILMRQAILGRAVEPDRPVPRHTGKCGTPSLGRSTPMERFVRRENIRRFRKLLREAEDDAERQRILTLLKEEEQKREADELNDFPMFHEL
jgi:hypothetical protein